MKKVDTNTIVAVAALVTSVVAVFIAWDEGRLQRRSMEAQFLPLVDVYTSLQTGEDGEAVSINITNKGHGVAYIKTFRLVYLGEDVTGWDGFADSILSEELAATADLSWADPVGYLQPGDQVAVIHLRWPLEVSEAFANHFQGEAIERIAQFDAEVCYCSMFSSCWVNTITGDVEPRAVSSCPTDPKLIENIWVEFLSSREGFPE
ncbi:MAG: hypothetical protein V2I43_26220 [Parvularcula sp.]|nr:hypothetical protein [Parvularcula sp.]